MTLRLDWSNEQEEMEITEELIARLEQLLTVAGSMEDVTDGEVALTFVDNETIHQLNKQYRGIDRPTDVLSFSMMESGEEEPDIWLEDEMDTMLGDIVISVPIAIAQSKEYGHSVEREIGFLFVHGFLHLIGYDHDTEEAEKEMFSVQEVILTKAGLPR
jgi:probable rRNA maturation factor